MGHEYPYEEGPRDAVTPFGVFQDTGRPLYHGEKPEPETISIRELLERYLIDQDPFMKEAESWFLDTRVELTTRSDLYVRWHEEHSRILRALYAALIGVADPRELHGDGGKRMGSSHAKALKRLAAILPPTRGVGKVGMTTQGATRYLDCPEDMTASHVQAIIDATGVTLEFLRGQVLEPTATESHGDAQGLAAIYDGLSERGKETLWSVAVALSRSEQ